MNISSLCVVWLLAAVATTSATLRATRNNSQPDDVQLDQQPSREPVESSINVEHHEQRETLDTPRIVGGTAASPGQFPFYGKPIFSLVLI